MGNDTVRQVGIGEVVGFGRVWNPFVKKAKVRVRANGRVVAVLVDHRQLPYIRERHSAGREIAIGFYGGEWHIGSPPSIIGEGRRDVDEGDLVLLQRETENLDLISLIGRPASGRIGPGCMARALAIGDAGSAEDAMLEDIEKYRDYLRLVELDTMDNGRELLDRLGLAHLKDAGNGKKQAADGDVTKAYGNNGVELLEMIIAQNEKIISNQNELIRILADYSGSCRNYPVPGDRFN